MTGSQLASKLEAPPLPAFAHQLAGEDDGPGMRWIIRILVGLLNSEPYAKSQVRLEDLPNVFGTVHVNIKVKDWAVFLDKALRRLGRYDISDELPWNCEEGHCLACAEYATSKTSDGKTYQTCEKCYRRFWQYNIPLGLWQQVVDYDEWDAIRQQALRGNR